MVHCLCADLAKRPLTVVREGLVVDIEKTAAALGNALKEAEIMSNRKIGPVTVAVSGENIEGITAKGSSVISDDTVSVSEVNKVLEMSRTEVPDQKNVRILATLERGYEIDGQKGIMRPEGMTGRRLSGDVYLLFASHNALANMEKCILQAGAQVEGDFVFSALAAAESVLSEDEKDLGVCLVDIGASISEIVIFSQGTVRDACAIPIAGDDIRNDIAHMHHVSLEAAERAKCQIGVADGDGFIDLGDASGIGDNKVGRSVVCDTIIHRVDEILERVQQRIDNFTRDETHPSAGLVLVGDGALLPGIVELAKKRGLMARLGKPRYRGEKHEIIASPRFAVGAGLLSLAAGRKEALSALSEADVLTKIKRVLRRIFHDGEENDKEKI